MTIKWSRSVRSGVALVAFATVLLSTLAAIGGNASGQAAGTEGADANNIMIPPIEEPRDTVVELWSITLTYTEEGPITYRNQAGANVVVALGDGSPLGYVSRTRPTEANGVFQRNGNEPLSVTFTVPRTDEFRYLYYRVGPYIEADGIALWNDQLDPLLTTIILDDLDGPNITFDVDYNVIPAGPTPGPYVENCNFFNGRHWTSDTTRNPALTWTGATADQDLEIWYDGQPLVTQGIDPTSGRFAFPFPRYSFKLASNSGFQLVTVVSTDAGERRVAVRCHGYWHYNAQPRPDCTVDLARGVLWVRTPDGAPTDLYPSRLATEPVLTGVTKWRRAAPRGIQRTDKAEFGFLHRVALDDGVLDQLGTVELDYNGLGIRFEDQHLNCETSVGDTANGAKFALGRILDPQTRLWAAGNRLEDRPGALHLLELLRRDAASGRSSYDTPRLRGLEGSGGLNVSIGWQDRYFTAAEKDGRWVITTESLCRVVADLLDAQQFVPSAPCGTSGIEPSTDLCLAYRLTRGVCNSEVPQQARPVLQATSGLLQSPADYIHGVTPEVRRALWSLPGSLEAQVASVTVRSASEAGVVLRTLRGGSYELELERIDGKWKFTLESICESGLIEMDDLGIID